MTKIAVIGAGIAGLACAKSLRNHGFIPTLFDKSRGFGGRICTKRTEVGRFDHGAQYITARDAAFQAVVAQLRAENAIGEWNGRFGLYEKGRFQETEVTATRWVGVPRMSVIGRHLAADLDCVLSHRIIAMNRKKDGWHLDTDAQTRLGPFEMVVVTCPGPQAAELIPGESFLSDVAHSLQYAPCWAAMCSYPTRLQIRYDGFHLNDSLLSWACRDNSKPGRAPGERWVLHANPDWSRQNLELDSSDVKRQMLEFFKRFDANEPSQIRLHRWRFALSSQRQAEPALFDEQSAIGLCGDALSAPKVEGAWLSGQQMADRIIGLFGASRK